MRKNATPGGKVVATASAAGIVPHETYPEYDGAKAAVINFVRATARILKSVSYGGVRRRGRRLTNCAQKENISINTICPGIVHTSIIPQEMVDAVSEDW